MGSPIFTHGFMVGSSFSITDDGVFLMAYSYGHENKFKFISGKLDNSAGNGVASNPDLTNSNSDSGSGSSSTSTSIAAGPCTTVMISLKNVSLDAQGNVINNLGSDPLHQAIANAIPTTNVGNVQGITPQPNGCSNPKEWQSKISADVNWISGFSVQAVAASPYAAGAADVHFKVSPNSGAARTGHINIEDQQVIVQQAGNFI